MRQSIVVFTGAGISKESGLPTFRDNEGIWSRYDADTVATPQGFEADTETALKFYNELRMAVANVRPNHAHVALAELETEYDVTVITQNVDNLHERAGSKHVIHLHGELTKVTSSRNRLSSDCISELHLTAPIKLGDVAADGSQLRPHVVMFGEYLTDMPQAIDLVKQADIFIVIGTSLKVFPANRLIKFAHPEIPRFIIDPNEIDVPPGFVHIKQSATVGIDDFLTTLNNMLND